MHPAGARAPQKLRVSGEYLLALGDRTRGQDRLHKVRGDNASSVRRALVVQKTAERIEAGRGYRIVIFPVQMKLESVCSDRSEDLPQPFDGQWIDGKMFEFSPKFVELFVHFTCHILLEDFNQLERVSGDK